MRIGAHVSAAGGIQNTMIRAANIGADCAQLFVGPPQRWFGPAHRQEDIDEFCRLAASLSIGPNVVHALYLVNLASPDPVQRQRSVAALVHQMHWSQRIDAMGLVVHVGSRKGVVAVDEALDFVVAGIEEILTRSTGPMFLIENTAGMGTSIGSDFADIGAIIHRLGNDSRVGVCLETAHTFEAGRDIRTRLEIEAVFDEFDRTIGLEHLYAIHANDSKTPLGSNVDRHENIGMGHIGAEAFGAFLNHPAVADLPFYLEVPGLLGHGPDRENIALLRQLAGLASLPEAAEREMPRVEVPGVPL